MKINRYFERIALSPVSLDEQGIVAALKASRLPETPQREKTGGLRHCLISMHRTERVAAQQTEFARPLERRSLRLSEAADR